MLARLHFRPIGNGRVDGQILNVKAIQHKAEADEVHTRTLIKS
jgi:hypothetical protein